MRIEQDFDLTNYNTFGVPARAKFFTMLESEDDIATLFATKEFKDNKKLFLGGGSNVLFINDWDGIVVLNKLKGIEIVSEDEESTLVRSAGGEAWQDLVEYTIAHNLWGIENMSYIPGSVGAGPMQNIGAYGQEIKDVFENLEAYDLTTAEKKVFKKEACGFGYRDSCFKKEFKDKYFISSVTLCLSKNEKRNLEYKGLKNYFVEKNISVPTLLEISEAVGEIRKSKLPDPKVIGNAGSFFKNPFIQEIKLKVLLKDFPQMPYFWEENKIKVPAGWMIETCGWKGKRVGGAGVHDKQALVIVNYGGATGEEIKNLAEQIIQSVEEKFGIKLTPEVNFI